MLKRPFCHYCLRWFNDDDPQRRKTKDHRVPRSRGGKGGRNIVSCCAQCNKEKANMTEAEYREWIALGRPKKGEYMKSIGLVPLRKTEKPPATKPIMVSRGGFLVEK